MDIVIYTTPEKLEHKKGADGYAEYYWHLSKIPKNFKVRERIYFATEGFIRGYFICSEFNNNSEETLCWYAKSWTPINSIPCKSFQGFKYMR